VDHYYLGGVWIHSLQSMQHRFCAATATWNYCGNFAQLVFLSKCKKTLSLLSSQNNYDFLNYFTTLEGFERVDENRRARQPEKLLRPLARHPRALPGGGNDCDIHNE
jgi:hypothetical protein